MASSNRRWYLLLGASFALVTGGVAAGVVLVFTGTSSAAPTKAEYLARVAAISRVYGPKLDKVPPPSDIAVPGEIATSVGQALPILKAETRAVRALRPPTQLRSQLARWLELNDRAIAKLEEALRAAREPDLSVMGVAYVQFLKGGAAAERLGKAIGFPRPPC